MAEGYRRNLFVADGDIAAGSGDNTLDNLPVGSVGDLLYADSGETVGMRWGNPDVEESRNIIRALLGTPDTAYDFQTTSLTGLTAIGTPVTEDANTSVADCYFVSDDLTTVDLCGRYFAAPTAPYTVVARVLDANMRDGGGQQAGIWVQEADGTGDIRIISARGGAPGVIHTHSMTGPTATPAIVSSGSIPWHTPFYLFIRVNTSTNWDFGWSKSGNLWVPSSLDHNPSATMSADDYIGFGIMAQTASATLIGAAFDFVYVYNSALTLVGIG